MPAYTRHGHRHLIVELVRPGEETVRIHCNSPEDAMEQGVMLLVRAGVLFPGDLLGVIDGDEGPELPEASRASHMGG